MARRLLISVEEALLSFGGKPLFEGINLYINEGDKICLVGKNGAGKTTLMRLLEGSLELDGGKRFVLPGTTIGYLEQKVDFVPAHNVHQFVLSGLKQDQYTEEKSHLADIIIGPLELEPAAKMSELSGGQLRRAALARALIEEPDLLMLDEPTNHLDLGAIEWLEQYLRAYRGALVCVSHDRAFLANISKKVFWIDRGLIRTCPKGYADFDDWAEMVLEQEARELQNMQKKLEGEIGWTQGGVTGRRKRNVRRMRELGRLRDKIRADRAAYHKATAKVEMDALEVTVASHRIAEFKHVYKSFERDGRTIPILNDFNINLIRGDRIGILGKNGSGKSTFLKLLIDDLQPDKGTIKRGKTVDITYFDQNRIDLKPDETLWSTLCPDGGDYVFLGAGDKQKARHVCGYLKDFLFDPKMAKDYVRTLSGGQQNRLLLAKMLASPGNLLILDEPTNDLDMDTLDILTDILADYPGTLIIVSHDRDFLDRTITEVLAFEGDGKVESYIGGYSDYLEARNIIEGKAAAKKPEPIKAVEKPVESKMPNKLKYELEKLPTKIKTLTEEVAALNDTLSNPELYTKEPEKFDTTSRRLGRAQSELEQSESRWLELDEMSHKHI